MFWRVAGLASTSPVEAILDKESYTLEELLDEDDLIQELKSLNTRLVNFLKGADQVKQLIGYVVDQPANDADDKRMFKYPFIACEIFTCEIDQILSTVVENEKIMDSLFSFLEPDRPHPNLLAGYFSKVASSLLLRKTPTVMNYLQGHKDILERLCSLIGITSIMEVLMKLVGADDTIMMYHSDKLQWLSDTTLLDSLLSKLSPENLSDVHANTAETLSAIARTTPSALALQLATPKYIGQLFAHVLEGPDSMTSVIHSLSVCITLLDPKRALMRGQPLSIQQQQQQQQQAATVETIEGMLARLGELLGLLKVENDAKILPTPYGQLTPPLGIHRLKIVEFIGVLLGTNSDAVRTELMRLGGIKTCIDLFFRFHFNNFLHHHVERMINACLESGSDALLEHLFGECSLLNRILDAYANPNAPDMRAEKTDTSRPAARSGFMGHLTRIANKINHLANSNTAINGHVQANERWLEWRQTDLKKQNIKENVYQWSCGRPAALDDRQGDSDDDDFSRDRDFDIASISLTGDGNSPRPFGRYGQEGESDEMEEASDLNDSYESEMAKAEEEMDQMRLNSQETNEQTAPATSEWDSSGAGSSGSPLEEYISAADGGGGEESKAESSRGAFEGEGDKTDDVAVTTAAGVAVEPTSKNERAPEGESSTTVASSESSQTTSTWVAFQDPTPIAASAAPDPLTAATPAAPLPSAVSSSSAGDDATTGGTSVSSLSLENIPLEDVDLSPAEVSPAEVSSTGTDAGEASSAVKREGGAGVAVGAENAPGTSAPLVEDFFANAPPTFHADFGAANNVGDVVASPKIEEAPEVSSTAGTGIIAPNNEESGEKVESLVKPGESVLVKDADGTKVAQKEVNELVPPRKTDADDLGVAKDSEVLAD